MPRKTVLYIAMSLDGYIAKPNDDLDFLSLVNEEGQTYGYTGFIQTVDTVILGRKTYDKILSYGISFPHADKQTFVITRTPRPDFDNVTFYSRSLKELVTQLKEQAGKTIYIDGGAEVVNELMKENLIDEFIISIIPVFLGEGISLFKTGRPEETLELIYSSSYEKGLVQLHYRIKK